MLSDKKRVNDQQSFVPMSLDRLVALLAFFLFAVWCVRSLPYGSKMSVAHRNQTISSHGLYFFFRSLGRMYVRPRIPRPWNFFKATPPLRILWLRISFGSIQRQPALLWFRPRPAFVIYFICVSCTSATNPLTASVVR